MNPPYGREIGQWVKKAYESSKKGAIVVALLPARTDTKWFHDYVMKAREVRLIRGRVKFVGAKASAPFPSMAVVFSPGDHWMPRFSSYEVSKDGSSSISTIATGLRSV
jgi:site-specific DNA-methyltransferase (adenine-specific)